MVMVSEVEAEHEVDVLVMVSDTLYEPALVGEKTMSGVEKERLNPGPDTDHI